MVRVSDARARPTASIIVPAYNEQDRIAPLLPVLSLAARECGFLVIISCNGCTDRTVEMARNTDDVRVLELARASKPHALNAAEEVAADVFPRLYVDADVRTDVGSLRRLVDALRVDGPLAVRPVEDYEWDGAPLVPKLFYRSRYLVPSSRDWLEAHIEGHHIYGTNAAGRGKFERFPEEGQMMEDAFFDRMFDAHEKLAVRDARVVVPLPRSTRALVRGLTRIYQGNWELDAWLAQHRPDRLERTAEPTRRPRDGVRARVRGRATFSSLAPTTVAAALTALVVRRVAINNARRLTRMGHQADWR
jgi:glycosyltransferase involved in cell wall biosynthesis